jgi:hypothetical protein
MRSKWEDVDLRGRDLFARLVIGGFLLLQTFFPRVPGEKILKEESSLSSRVLPPSHLFECIMVERTKPITNSCYLAYKHHRSMLLVKLYSIH